MKREWVSVNDVHAQDANAKAAALQTAEDLGEITSRRIADFRFQISD
jgi:hypothetical protein